MLASRRLARIMPSLVTNDERRVEPFYDAGAARSGGAAGDLARAKAELEAYHRSEGDKFSTPGEVSLPVRAQNMNT
eukprot:9212440-Pyramimonas_sp.AAC.1